MKLFRIDVPLAGLRPYEARDYQESLPLPPHSTVFGCLLSAIGVEREKATEFAGTRLAVGGIAGDRSTVLRKMRRDPANPPRGRPAAPAFRPEYQELISDLVIWAGVSKGSAARDLAEELIRCLQDPSAFKRHGIVSLGESCFMVDAISKDDVIRDGATVLRPDENGSLTLTTWVDFTDRTRTRTARFFLTRDPMNSADAVPIEPGT